METFGQRLRRLREERGLTVVDLGNTAGCAEGTVRQLETGHTKSPNLPLGLRLADALHVDVRYLALGENPSLGERLAALEAQVQKLDTRLQNVERRR